jgi:hypothetical protein
MAGAGSSHLGDHRGAVGHTAQHWYGFGRCGHSNLKVLDKELDLMNTTMVAWTCWTYPWTEFYIHHPCRRAGQVTEQGQSHLRESTFIALAFCLQSKS